MDILLYQEQSPSVFRCSRQMIARNKLKGYTSTANTAGIIWLRPWNTNPFFVNLDLDPSDFKCNESNIQIWICQKKREIRFLDSLNGNTPV